MIPDKNNDTKKLYYLHYLKPLIDLNDYEFFDITNIKKIRKNSVNNIYIGDLLDYLTDDEAKIMLDEICFKLKKNGKLYIQSNDSKCLAAALLYDNIDSKIFKNILFSYKKKNIYTLTEIKNILDTIEFIYIDKYRFLNGIQYYVECHKK